MPRQARRNRWRTAAPTTSQRREVTTSAGQQLHRALLLVMLGLIPSAAPLGAGEEPGPALRRGRVLVVANSSDPASLELAAQYRRAHRLPAVNVLGLPVTNAMELTAAEFRRQLLDPILARWEQLGPATDFAVLMRGIPYRVGTVSTTTALLFGGVGNIRPVQGYFGQDRSFDITVPAQHLQLHPATMLTGFTAKDAEKLIWDSLVTYENPEIAGTFYFCDGQGPRGVRNLRIPDALKTLRAAGAKAEHISEPDLYARTDVIGQFTGATHLHLDSNTYRPGSIVDNLTSFGGRLFEESGQMSVLSFIQHGACAAYGTVAEPMNLPRRWAVYQLPTQYVKGYNLIECYLQTVLDHTKGLVVGDPLLAPFAPRCELRLKPESDTVRVGDDVAVQFEVDAAAAGAGLAWAAVWLDEQNVVFAAEPNVPADTRCSLRVVAGDTALHTRELTVSQPTRLREVLDQFAGHYDNGVSLYRCGKHGGRLLVRWQPPATEERRPAFCELTMSTGDQTLSFQRPLRPVPLRVTAGVFDFGSNPPRAGDCIRARVPPMEAMVAAQAGDTAYALLRRLTAKLQQLYLFGPHGDWTVDLRLTDAGEDRTGVQLVILARHGEQPTDNPIRLHIDRTDGSEFAMHTASAPPLQSVVVGPEAEAVLTPAWPVPPLRHRLTIPANSLTPGYHTLTGLAATRTGTETTAVSHFTVGDPNQPTTTLSLDRTRLALGDPLTVRASAGSLTAIAYTRLMVDDIPVSVWEPGTGGGSARLRLPAVCPGPHQAWVEWTEDPGLPGLFEHRSVLASSPRRDIFVRRPLRSGLRFRPTTVTAGTGAVIELQGPYLHDDVRFFIDGIRVLSKRRQDYGLFWTVNVGYLQPGQHQLEVRGDPNTETFGPLSEPLTVVAPTETVPE